ncbi:MAG: hypothetical protein K940chlam8_00188 [Chlamydiae bacterium]|nr:hypothetical protein [Chlamydiota bacterium]
MLFFQMVFSSEQESFVLCTMPKSGSYLIEKSLNLLIKKKAYYIPPKHIQRVFKQEITVPQLHFFFFHTHYPVPLEFLDNNKLILNIRDLRDVLISYLFFVSEKESIAYQRKVFDMVDKSIKKRKNFETFVEMVNDEKPVNERLCFILECAKDKDQDFLYLTNQFGNVFEIYTLDHPNIFVCRFEDLLSPRGGGDRLKQKETLKNVAQFLDVPLSESEADEIAHRLWGGTPTFRNRPGPKVGQWKQYFDDEIKTAFKEVFGEYLIYFGYEQDNNW